MEYCVYLVFAQNVLNLGRRSYIAVNECEIWRGRERSCIVQRSAIVEFVETDYIVRIWVG